MVQTFSVHLRGRVNKLAAYPISDGPRWSRFSCFVSIYVLYVGKKLLAYRVILYKILNIKHG